jgi:hypothetical protein
MLHQHPKYSRIFFVCGDTHPAVRPQADQRKPAFETLRRELRQHGFYATAYEAEGEFWVDAVGEFIPFHEARRLIEGRV